MDLPPPDARWGAAQREYQWELFGPHEASALIRHHPRLVTDDLAAGRLIERVPGWAPKCGIVHAIFPSRRDLLPSVRTLADFLGEEFSRSDIA